MTRTMRFSFYGTLEDKSYVGLNYVDVDPRPIVNSGERQATCYDRLWWRVCIW